METFTDVVAAVLLLAGSALTLLGAIGVNRLGDYLSRTHAATKPGTLGVVLSLAGAMLRVDGVSMQTKLALAMAFQLLTAPVAAHLMAGAARRAGIPAPLAVDESAPAHAVGGPSGGSS
jgi:multicomponent Na+:H+ antiporter subunit G